MMEVIETMELVLANSEQVEELSRISKAAFDTDIEVGAHEIGGPPDYDSVQWHRSMQKSGNLYTLLNNKEVIGGALLFRDQKDSTVLYVGRIFVAPQYHRRGYGIELMELVEKKFSDVCCIRLDTPIWNVRTNSFYKKCGFREKRRDKESVYYEKVWK